MPSFSLRWAILVAAAALPAQHAAAQGSLHALRFHGQAAAGQDRLSIAIDDDAGGPDASAPCDVGAGSFTFEFWVRGTRADNPTRSSGAQGSYPDARWRGGNVVIDRSIDGTSGRAFGVSIAGGRVRFGTGRGDGASLDALNTLEGDVDVLDGTWHHVAVARDATTGRKVIYVDALVDVIGPPGVSIQDLSYPDAGVPSTGSTTNPLLVVGAGKSAFGGTPAAFRGRIDELRIWTLARRGSEIDADKNRAVPADALGLVAQYRFEEGAGTAVHDSSARQSPVGALSAGQPGNGEWVAYASDPLNTAPLLAAALPPGFTKSLVADGLVEPNALAVASDGRVFVAERGGSVRGIVNGVLLPAPVVSIPVNNEFGERGLTGLALDPDFAVNGHLYAYFTTTEPRNRVSRFTIVGAAAAPGSELVVWQNAGPAGQFHHGGGLGFGPDGKLYIATGDQFDGANSGLLTNHHGKILRVHPAGGAPADNPFVGVPGALPEIWARGLRNPFRMAFDRVTGRLWIGDVGGNGASSYEEVNRGVAGAHYGWPEQEGAACYGGDCSAYQAPAFSYRHDDPAYVPGILQACVVAGAVCRSPAFPPEHQGNLFIGDYANRWIRRLVVDGAGTVTASLPFAPAPDTGTIADLEFGPDGALYFVTWGVPWTGPVEGAKVWRIAYNGGANLLPVALAAASPANGPAPLHVQFTGSNSFDPDQGPSGLTHAWNFGDGSSSTAADPAHVYAVAGNYSATLTVGDGAALVSAAPLPITVGNPPVAAITAPAQGARYVAGDTIVYGGGAVDVEDGPLAAGTLTWRVVLVHAGHEHPFLGPLTGAAGGSFTIPTSGHAPADTFYRIVLSATDSDGLAGAASVEILPTVTPVTIDTQPSGIALTVDGDPLATPGLFQSLVGFHHVALAPKRTVQGGVALEFDRWSDGVEGVHTVFVAPAGGGTLTAHYRPAPHFEAIAIAAVHHNAQHDPQAGQTFADAGDSGALCFGRDAPGSMQLGLEFVLAVPRHARIHSADLEFTAAASQTGAVSAYVRAYDVGTAPPFVLGSPTALSLWAPTTPHAVAWTPLLFGAGEIVRSPDLAGLVHAVVKRADWAPGNTIGFVIDGGPSAGSAWRCVRNFASGQAPRLRVRWSPGPAGPVGSSF